MYETLLITQKITKNHVTTAIKYQINLREKKMRYAFLLDCKSQEMKKYEMKNYVFCCHRKNCTHILSSSSKNQNIWIFIYS